MSMTTTASDTPAFRRLARYRAMAESARREASRSRGEARESYLFIADQWDRRAAMAQKPEARTKDSFG
jgi:hypothetical protein